MLKKIKYFVLGILVATIINAGLGYAEDSYFQLKKVDYPIFVNGLEVNLEALILNFEGSTYIPLRKVANITGSEVVWNNDSKSIFITNTPKEIIKEVPKEVIKEVVKEVPVEKIVYVTITPTPIPTQVPLGTQVKNTEALSIISHKYSKDFFKIINGYIKNSSTNRKLYRIKANLKDSNGNVVLNEFNLTQDIEPNSIRAFSVMILDNIEFSTYDLEIIEDS